MGKLRRDANIFKVLETIRDVWTSIERYSTSGLSAEEIESWLASQRRFVFDGEDIRERFFLEFEDFLYSCAWTDNAVTKEIVGYIQNGTPLNQIGDLVGLKNSAFRMRMARMTDTVNGLLFDGQTCPEGIYSLSDLGALKKCLVRLWLIRNPIDAREEFSLRQIGWIKTRTEGVDAFNAERKNLDKYFKSVLFFALISHSFALKLLDDIDPSALAYAFRDLRSDDVNSTKLLFSLLLRRLTFESVSCKEELLSAKREYQSYVG